MAIRPSLELRQTQRLAMTPQLRQAIGMLQMTAPELSAFLAAETERNPLLSLGEGDDAPAPAEPRALAAVDAEIGRGDLAAGEAALESAPENLYEGAERIGAGGGLGFEDVDGDGAAGYAAPRTLADHVRDQLALARLAPIERALADLLCAELDEDGYLRVDMAATAERLGAPLAALERAAEAIRGCDPAGVGARDLAECLRLQLAERGGLDTGMAALLTHLTRLPELPAAEMAALCGLDAAGLGARLEALRALDPRPGRRFAPAPLAVAAPDLLARPDGAGGWVVTLNPDAAPRLLVDHGYAARIGAGACPKTKLFLADCAQSAGWLKRSLDQRARTMVKVGAEIVRRQTAFLEKGFSALRPMTLRDVAEAAGVHESTVSRVAAGKTMAAPRGVFELRALFTAALGDGEAAHSAAAVRDRIRALVAGEPPGKPLSDDRIVKLLNDEGVDVARRTVAKYREALGIPSSVARRRRAGAAVALC